jgi:hypothetical protein
MRMNGDHKERAGKLVGVLFSVVAPALCGALCAALEHLHINSTYEKKKNAEMIKYGLTRKRVYG